MAYVFFGAPVILDDRESSLENQGEISTDTVMCKILNGRAWCIPSNTSQRTVSAGIQPWFRGLAPARLETTGSPDTPI